jgi:hypothetical protein
METQAFVKEILLYFGGISTVLIGLVGFLGHISTKRIINGDLAKHKLELENLKSQNKIKQDEIMNDLTKEIKQLEASNTQYLNSLKQEHESRLEIQKAESTNLLEKVKNEMNTVFLKSEAYTSISKEMYQQLFNKRIEVYTSLLNVKIEIDKSVINNAEFIEVHCEDPTHFTDNVQKINDFSQSNSMLISNQLAVLSNKLHEKSSQIFASAKVKAFYAEMGSVDMESGNCDFEAVMDASDSELRKMFAACGDIYDEWFMQLESDVSQIRSILDFSGNFLKQGH